MRITLWISMTVLLSMGQYLLAQSNQRPSTDTNKPERIAVIKKQIRVARGDQFDRLQVELAQMGEREQLQQIQCEVDYGVLLTDRLHGAVQLRGLSKLKAVGGWFAVRAFARFLDDNSAYTEGRADGDSLYTLQQQALLLLPHVVPNPPPIQLSGFGRDRSREIVSWKEWLEKNHDSLSRLKPTGLDIVSSEQTCHKVLRSDPASRALFK